MAQDQTSRGVTDSARDRRMDFLDCMVWKRGYC
jgi:hypothetical protein